MIIRAIVWAACPFLLTAAELAPRPAGGARGPGRLMMSFEVEAVIVKPEDAESMATWAVFAAAGYRLVGTTAKSDGSVVLFLERMNPAGTIQLPAVVARNAAVAATAQARIHEQQRERHPVPAAAPAAPAPQPAEAPPAK